MIKSLDARHIVPILVFSCVIVLLAIDSRSLFADIALWFGLGMLASNLLWERAERRKPRP